MSLRLKFNECVPFPTSNGTWIRLCFIDSPNKKGALIVVQGNVLHFEDEIVLEMAHAQETTPEVIREGDARSEANKILVAYTRLESAGLIKDRNQVKPVEGSKLILPTDN